MTNELRSFFGASTSQNPTYDTTVANRICNVFRMLKDFPSIRAGSGAVAQRVARLLGDRMQNDIRGNPALATTGSVLLLLDRSYDPVNPLFHDLSYQAALEDLNPLKNGIYTMTWKETTQTATKKEEKQQKKEFIIDEEDHIWTAVRHYPINRCVNELRQRREQLNADHPLIVQYLAKNGKDHGLSLTEVGEVTRLIPVFNAKRERFGVHNELLGLTWGKAQNAKIDTLSGLETKIVTGESAVNMPVRPADLLKDMKAVMADRGINSSVKARLVMLYSAAVGADSNNELTRDAGLGPLEKAALDALPMLEPWTAEKKSRRKSVPPLGGADSMEFERYAPHLKQLLTQLLNDTLPVDLYPPIGAKVSAKATVKTATAGRFGAKKVVWDDGLQIGDEVLQLASPSRIFVFVIGGVTHSEMRVTYDLARSQQREIIIGGTSLLTPDGFIRNLGTLSAPAAS